jgi:AraC-like DNA-binding protein
MSVRQALSDLSRWRERVEGIEPREAAAVFRLVDIFLRALGFLSREAVSAAQNAILNASKRALKDPRLQAASLADIASRIGYQADYLNRALKQGCGLTLGQLRSEMRVQKAKRMLSENLAIAAIANAIGFDDANYFSRWFRQLTGLTPTAWRKAEVT